MSTLANVSKLTLYAIVLAGLTQGAALASQAQTETNMVKQTVTGTDTEANSVKQQAAMELSRRNSALVNEAATANDEILKAIASLENNDHKAAYRYLSDASGKLDVVLARDPHLKLAAIGVRVETMDLQASPRELKRIIEKAKKQLDDGHLQAARALLGPLTSELRVTTDFLPMETYPDAIRLASRDIQEGKQVQAEQTLYDALNTIVTNEDIIPLPPIKAEADVMAAEKLVASSNKNDHAEAVKLLDQAKLQLDTGKLLGYGDYGKLKKEVASVQDKMKAGEPNHGLFARLKSMFHKAEADL